MEPKKGFQNPFVYKPEVIIMLRNSDLIVYINTSGYAPRCL